MLDSTGNEAKQYCKEGGLIADIALLLLTPNRCDYLWVTLTRPCTITILMTQTLDRYNVKAV